MGRTADVLFGWAVIFGGFGIWWWLAGRPLLDWYVAPPDYRAECIEATTDFVGYYACEIDGRCQLSLIQRSWMASALEDSLMQCKRMEFQMGLEAAKAMEGHFQGDGDDDSSRSTPKADSDQPTT